jgi:hypothetical protein
MTKPESTQSTMTENDLTLLREAGWSADVLTVLTHLGYQLDHHDPVTEVIEVSTPSDAHPSMPRHGFTLHRNDPPKCLVIAIFEAGVLNHQKQTREAFQSLLTAAGMQLR